MIPQDMTVRLNAAAAIVVMSWHGPEPSNEFLKANCTMDPRFMHEEREKLRKKLAPPRFHPDAKIPMDSLHR